MAYQFSSRRRIQARLLEVIAYLAWPIIRIFLPSGKKSSSAPERILLIEPFQMGDVISLTALIDPIARLRPDAAISLWVHDKNIDILRKDPRITQIFTSPFPWNSYGRKGGTLQQWIRLFQTIKVIRLAAFDVGIDTRGDVRSQILLRLIGCQQRIGCRDYCSSNMSLHGLLLTESYDLREIKHRYRRNYEIASRYLAQTLPPLQMPVFCQSHLKSPRKIVIHPSGGWLYKRWRNERWEALLQELGRHHEVVIIGTQADSDVIEPLIRTCGTICSFRRPSISELTSLLSETTLFIGIDSGPMNLAASMNVPVLALFGPGDSDAWYPLSEKSRFIHHKEHFPCNPCFQISCPYAGNNCMDQITAHEVIKISDELLNNLI